MALPTPYDVIAIGTADLVHFVIIYGKFDPPELNIFEKKNHFRSRNFHFQVLSEIVVFYRWIGCFKYSGSFDY